MDVKQIAETIYRQFGGRRAAVMIGMYGTGYRTDEAGNPVFSFRFKAGRKANFCSITLTPADLYDMVIERISLRKTGLDRKEVARFEGIFCDQLQELFERETGLYLSL